MEINFILIRIISVASISLMNARLNPLLISQLWMSSILRWHGHIPEVRFFFLYVIGIVPFVAWLGYLACGFCQKLNRNHICDHCFLGWMDSFELGQNFPTSNKNDLFLRQTWDDCFSYVKLSTPVRGWIVVPTPSIHMLKAQPLIPQTMTIFRENL